LRGAVVSPEYEWVTTAADWEAAYVNPEALSWFEPTARMSLELIGGLGVRRDLPVVDVGGGAAPLAAALSAGGFEDVTVLDLSETALARARAATSEQISWLRQDVLTWRPGRSYGLWHDRAVLHFFTDQSEVDAYLRALNTAVASGGFVVLGVFAPDGPDRCSGMPVERYSTEALAALLGDEYELKLARADTHLTPAGKPQRFTWAGFQRH
jgi:trans-aconitate methyltransferase